MEIIELLIEERGKLDEAIGVLQRTITLGFKPFEEARKRSYQRRAKLNPAKPVRKPRSAASRKAQAAKMKTVWAAKRRKVKSRKKPAKKKPEFVKEAA